MDNSNKEQERQQVYHKLQPSSNRYNAELYERIRVLGKGSFGTAIVHRRHADGALVVLKEIDLLKLKQNADKLAMVIQEARIMSKLSHPNIIQYYNAYTRDNSKLVIEMEYARIGTLQTYLSLQTQFLDELEVLAVFRQILAGLEYLHSKSIVHLDLKMANIFVTTEGGVKIGDFGIARLMSRPQHHEQQLKDGANLAIAAADARPRLASVGARAASACATGGYPAAADDSQRYCQLGTLAYSSPERCMGGPTGFKSDIWSLGCLLYELVELRPLFPARSLAELVMSITQVRFEPMQRVDIQPGVRNLLMLMIARQPGDRPTASELVYLTDNLLHANAKQQQRSNQHALRKGETNGHIRHANKQPPPLVVSPALLTPQQPQPQSQPQQTLSYPHSLVYHVKLSSPNVQVDRVNLPQSKRIKEMAKGRSHYLVLTHDNIVYGWGTRHCGQLGGCNANSATNNNPSFFPGGRPARYTRSARNSFTAKDMHLFAASDVAGNIPTTPTTSNPLNKTHGTSRHHGLSLTQPSSLASSTQTLVVGSGRQPSTPPLLLAGGADNEPRPLADAPPTTRPSIIGELNKRKIVRLAAGNDFSVFLSKTGIVMACGDGSRGCLGRGELVSSRTPCMVDALLSMDVVGVACGPEHVVAVCANGQAFVWGNSRNGRLGLSRERLVQDRAYLKQDHLVVLPQLVEFAQVVLVKSVFCGDKCTVFIDSQHNCWACGENTNNRLGLDVRRRFKRTLLVERAWQPARISSKAIANNKHKIISCQLAANHASYLTSEGKLLVLGQDIDRSYKLRSELAAGRGRRPRASYNGHLLHMSASLQNSQIIDSRLLRQPLSKLIARLLATNQLSKFKLKQKANIAIKAPDNLKLTRQQKRSIEIYLKRSRAYKKLPFDCVLSVSCTPKFTLALTNDNRVYFWGARTHNKNDDDHNDHDHDQDYEGHLPRRADSFRDRLKTRYASDKMSSTLEMYYKKPLSIAPQLTTDSHNENFIKIGATNRSLMSSIQLIGSDQPILHARNPQLRAASLADLWILDYKPDADHCARSSGSLGSSKSSLSCQSCCCCCCCSINSNMEISCDSISNESNSSNSSECHCHCKLPQPRIQSQYTKNAPEEPDHHHLRHDAILEPQPIVSLYVPPMFGYNNCLIQLVNLFCFDEDRFFLVLDTTVKLASSSSSSGSRPSSRRGSLSLLKQLSSPTTPAVALNGQQHTPKQTARHNNSSGVTLKVMSGTQQQLVNGLRLNIVEESRSSGDSQRQQQTTSETPDVPNYKNQVNIVDSEPPECCRKVAASDNNDYEREQSCEEQQSRLFDSAPEFHLKVELSNGNTASSVTPPSVSAHTGFSLEEPRSISTFAPNFAGRHLMVRAPSLGDLSHDDRERPSNEAPMMRKLSFGRGSHSHSFGPSYLLKRGKSKLKSQGGGGGGGGGRICNNVNPPESTAVTMEADDTSSMPTWVRNEYLHQLSSGSSSSEEGNRHLQQHLASCSVSGQSNEHATCSIPASEYEQDDETCIGANELLEAASVISAELTLTPVQRPHLRQEQVFDSCGQPDVASRLSGQEDNSASSRSQLSISTAIKAEDCKIVEGLGAESELLHLNARDCSSHLNSSSHSKVEQDVVRRESEHYDNEQRPISRNTAHLCRSQSNISTVNRWFQLQPPAQNLELTSSGQLDLACVRASGEPIAENLLECSVYKSALHANIDCEALSSSTSTTSSPSQNLDELPNHHNHNANCNIYELPLRVVDGSSLEKANENKKLLTRQTGGLRTGSYSQQHGCRALSQSASCLPMQEKYTRLSESTLSHYSNINGHTQSPPPGEIIAQRESAGKTGSRLSLTSIRKSLLRIFC